jgi:hypothetical protein
MKQLQLTPDLAIRFILLFAVVKIIKRQMEKNT